MTLSTKQRCRILQQAVGDLGRAEAFRHQETGDLRYRVRCTECQVVRERVRPRREGSKWPSWSTRWLAGPEGWTYAEVLTRWEDHVAHYHLETVLDASGYDGAEA